MNISIVIIGMAIVTAIPRILPFTVPVEKFLPGFLIKSLQFVPVAALTALIIPGIFHVGTSHITGITGGLTAAGLSLLPKNNLIVTIFITFVVCLLTNMYLNSGA